MRIEYPEYYNRFHCVADQCKDTCCAGWEVDIDDDTYYYYKVVPGEFGERLRASMAEDEEGCWFPMTCDNRCPFLNDKNLCDIYAALGEESLSCVCTEYPRYYMDIGDYEQIDMSLSCMELGRVFFTETSEITYITEENDACPEEQLSPEDAARLESVVAQRRAMIAIMQSGEGTYAERLARAGLAACPESTLPAMDDGSMAACPDIADLEAMGEENADTMGLVSTAAAPVAEPDVDLLAVLDQFEALNDGWYETLASLHAIVEAAGEDRIRPIDDPRHDEYLTKLAIYLIYRYSIDSYLEGEDCVAERSRRLIARSLRIMELMCVVRRESNGGTFTVEDIIDIAHRFSKEVEHSDDNIERIKDPVGELHL